MNSRCVKPMEKVVFLDRDGVISKDSPDHIKSWDEFIFLPNAKEGIKLLTDHDFHIIVITNQSVIARGMTKVEELEDMHKKMIHEIETYGGKYLISIIVHTTQMTDVNAENPNQV